MTERAAIYIRVSTDEQKLGHSLEAQESEIREYAKRKGYKIYDVYDDGGYSGKDFDRPAFQRLFTDIANDKIDAILVWKVDRLSRNNTDVLSFIDKELAPRGKKIIITSIDMDSSDPVGKMFISLLGTFATYERVTIIDRVKSGMRKRAEKGLWNGGAMLGYDSVDRRLVINKRESEVVKDIFNLRADGKGYKFIVNILNSSGEKTKRGKDFSIAGIKGIVHNPVYIGKMVWKKHENWNEKRRAGKSKAIIVDGEHEAIIDEELWNKVQQVNKLQNEIYTSNRNFNGNFLLSGILKCPKCGAGMVMSKTKKKNSGDYYLYYMCQAYHSKGNTVCKPNLVKKEQIESKVIKEISFLVNNDDILHRLVKELNSDSGEEGNLLKSKLDKSNEKLKKLHDKRLKLDNDYFEGKLEADIFNRLMVTLEKEIEQLKKVIRDSEYEISIRQGSTDTEQVMNTLKYFDDFFDKVEHEEKKLLVRTLIKEIRMAENREEIGEITFWFSPNKSLPSSKVSRTVPQIVVKQRVEVELSKTVLEQIK